ncbi:MAG: ATP-binding protein [Oligoflexia bacterium]|nr:ATP-binding protein [Oligoflexia bacterium]
MATKSKLVSIAKKKSLNITTALSQQNLTASCDQERIFQVLSNLVGNAIKYTESTGSIHIAVATIAEGALFSVADTGKGIAPEDLPHIFQQFWQTKDTSKLGNGLGLFISKAIVDAHCGKIWAESKLGEGTTIYFTLPL